MEVKATVWTACPAARPSFLRPRVTTANIWPNLLTFIMAHAQGAGSHRKPIFQPSNKDEEKVKFLQKHISYCHSYIKAQCKMPLPQCSSVFCWCETHDLSVMQQVVLSQYLERYLMQLICILMRFVCLESHAGLGRV
jgi:hypothetical protein